VKRAEKVSILQQHILDNLNHSTPEMISWSQEQSLPTIQEATQSLIDEALNRAGGNQRSAAKILGISQQALSKRLLKNREK
jgi:transcriptional regulator with PAS, ATPase and Fis domain